MQLRRFSTVVLGMALTLLATNSTLGQNTSHQRLAKERPVADSLRVRSVGEEMVGFAPSHFFDGMKRVFLTRENFYILAVGAGAAAGTRPFDNDISDGLEDDDLDELEQKIPNKLGGIALATGGPLVVHLISRAFGRGAIANTTLYMFEAVATTQFFTLLIKESVHRTRPDQSNDLSFPSGHTSAMFSLASVAGKRHGLKVAVPGYALATFVGFTRVKSKKHFLTDVIAGATLGTIVGRSFVPSTGKSHSFSIVPMFDGESVGFVGFVHF